MKAESKFIADLEKKSKQQHLLIETQMIPDWARSLGGWLAVNPWRVLVPTAMTLYLIFRILLGANYREFILGLFGGFVR